MPVHSGVPRVRAILVGCALATSALCGVTNAELLAVGPGQRFARPEAALAAARPGDTIEIVAPADGELVLERAALLVTVSGLNLRASGRIVLDGTGFEYSGAGSIPRAIVQVEPAASGVTIEGLVFRNAHNESGNGAGVRVNGANGVTVRACEIFACDMGVMSSGGPGQGADQRYEDCLVHDNGSATMSGFSHNLYLGGEGVTLERCEVRDSTHGHNLKSRSRVLLAHDCAFSNSAEREVDLVDSDLTETPGSDAVLDGCTISKRADMSGNRGVIHFGRDGARTRRGSLTLRGCRVRTSYVSAVVTLSGAETACTIEDCLIENPAQRSAPLVDGVDGPSVAGVQVRRTALAPCYEAAKNDAPSVK